MIAAVCLSGLGACAGPVAGIVLGAITGTEDAPAAIPAPRINRAAIVQADLAAVFVAAETTGGFAQTIAVAKRGDAITYISPEQRSVVLRGGLISASRGFGKNLQAVETAANDPLVQKTLPAAWPARVTRTYFFAGHGPDYTPVTATCDVGRGGTQSVDVLGVTRTGTAIVETCRTDAGDTFTNTHFISAVSGDAWVTAQWTGPEQGMLTVQIIEPFDG
jgi:hypothetical protein